MNVRDDIEALRKAIESLRRRGNADSYDEGWDDAICTVLDFFDYEVLKSTKD